MLRKRENKLATPMLLGREAQPVAMVLQVVLGPALHKMLRVSAKEALPLKALMIMLRLPRDLQISVESPKLQLRFHL